MGSNCHWTWVHSAPRSSCWKRACFCALTLKVSTHSVQISRHCDCFKRVFRRLCRVSDPTFRSLSCGFHMQDTLSSGLLGSNSCSHRQVSFASSPRRLVRTFTSALHGSSVRNFVWMPMPSQIDCRHGSRLSFRVPVLSRDASSPSLLRFQLSERIITFRQNSSSLTAVLWTKQKESCFSTA